MAKKWNKEFLKLESSTKAKVLGLTATPNRVVDSSIVDTFFNGIQVEPLNLIDGIGLGFIPKIKYIVAYASLDDKKDLIDKRMTEIDRYKIMNLLNVENILKKYITEAYLKQNMKILIFVPRISFIPEARYKANKWFKSLYPNKVINIYTINSSKTKRQNDKELNDFSYNNSDNVIDIMISVDKLIEGLHLPSVSIEIALRKTKSNRVYFQQIGRVVNYNQPLIFDLINNSSHLYRIRKEYEINEHASNLQKVKDRTKIMFSDCIELIDETKDIETIISKYNFLEPIQYELKLKIIEAVDKGLKKKDIADKYNISVSSIYNIMREFNKINNDYFRSNESLHDIFIKNKDYLIESNGKINREEIAKNVGLGISQLTRLYKLEGIKLERMHKQLNLSKADKDKFIKIYNSNIDTTMPKRKAIVMKELNLSDREYNSCMSYKYIGDRIIKRKVPTLREYYEVVEIIKNNTDKTKTAIMKEFNISMYTINKVIKEYNIILPVARIQRRITEEDEKKIIDFYKEYGSINKIRKELKYHKNTIKKCLQKYNLL